MITFQKFFTHNLVDQDKRKEKIKNNKLKNNHIHQ